VTNQYNITFKKLASVVSKPERAFQMLVRNIMNEWADAGICPRIEKGEVVQDD
jgi:hypothetical protein